MSFRDGKLYKQWEDEQQHKFYLSRPLVLKGGYNSRRQAKRSMGNLHLVRCVLLRCCQAVLEVKKTSGLKTEQLEHVRQRKEDTCHFLGALFRRGIVEDDTMHRCIEMLLGVRKNLEGEFDYLNPDAVPNDINLNGLCTLGVRWVSFGISKQQYARVQVLLAIEGPTQQGREVINDACSSSSSCH
ncbi:hypothetical protein F441_03064 [Phytophthora nicotianae CJ01A1]|uniref:Uncharacterized protein n=4 Tax=Phytophthora nicotianae TaxID=4792 RepID=V9FAT2_PHYNI|nr:hypothetical protein F443_07406 [Phytophthora nicotianae P1569]ETK93921.1 hypothetical protein L915_02956 [Phytophthora nicotianae]ETP23869.1 hypothetical protein F441_03064 [Phytophthora nicotianae CJ01A1]ETP51869.1 hypothetical protein F442_03052 [Phytophthora nicotianae P10297]